MADLQETMGAVVRRERCQRCMTLKVMAERASLSVVYLGEIERGKKYPSASVLERLAGAMEMSAADLLELVADALRVDTARPLTTAIGFTLPGHAGPQVAVRRLVHMLAPEEATTMAELGAFFLARRGGAEGQVGAS